MSEAMETQKMLLRAIPAIHVLAMQPEVTRFREEMQVPHEWVVRCAQELVEQWRDQILNGTRQIAHDTPLLHDLSQELVRKLTEWMSPHLRRVINGTGVLLHTNLGRAVLATTAVKQVIESASYYTNLEFDIDNGTRGSRHSHVEDLICRLTGAESAMVVNNNAAAVYLVLRELANEKEVIVSRGQLVEIGGSFRVSEIMAESGARLVEVGTSNKTHVYDYERAIGTETALLMKVHTSNFRLVGFTSSVSTEELVQVGRKHQIPVYEDLGSGVLLDLRPYGIGDEPVVHEVIEAGVDVVSFSGDKLLGGPQAGIIAGKKKWIDRLKKNQLARVLRVDKMTLAGLEATLRLYLIPERAKEEIPVLRDIFVAIHEIKDRARSFIEKIRSNVRVHCELVDDVSEVGGGSLPGITLPTKVVVLEISGITAHQVQERLRLGNPPAIVRIARERVHIDFRTIQLEEIDVLVEAIHEITNQ